MWPMPREARERLRTYLGRRTGRRALGRTLDAIGNAAEDFAFAEMLAVTEDTSSGCCKARLLSGVPIRYNNVFLLIRRYIIIT